jgi:hypothetical protein
MNGYVNMNETYNTLLRRVKRLVIGILFNKQLGIVMLHSDGLQPLGIFSDTKKRELKITHIIATQLLDHRRVLFEI